MKKCIPFCISLLFSVACWAQNPNPSSSVDAYILDEMAAENIPGMATIIVKQGEVVWINAYGLADVENNIAVTDSTIFLMASVSKLVTATAVMQLYEAGQLELDKDINNYLPFPIEIPGYEADSITIRKLMTHTSSILDNDLVMDTYYSNGDPTISLAEVIERYLSVSGSDYSASANFLNAAPGSVYEYSNMATALAGYLVQVISGTDFNDYCRTNIFNKLCMEHTSWYLADFDTSQVARPHQWTGSQYTPYAHYGFADYPDGQLRTNLRDMARFLSTYLQGGTFNNQQLLSTASVNQMLTPQIPSLDATQGLNWYTEDIYLEQGGTVALWGHNGGESGVSTDVYINRDNQIAIAVFSNGEGDNLNVVDELYNYALELTPSGNSNLGCNTLSIAEETAVNRINIYPNPANNNAVIETQTGKGIYQLLDITGKTVLQGSVTSAKFTLDISTLSSGVYFISVSDGDKQVFGKVVKE